MVTTPSIITGLDIHHGEFTLKLRPWVKLVVWFAWSIGFTFNTYVTQWLITCLSSLPCDVVSWDPDQPLIQKVSSHGGSWCSHRAVGGFCEAMNNYSNCWLQLLLKPWLKSRAHFNALVGSSTCLYHCISLFWYPCCLPITICGCCTVLSAAARLLVRRPRGHNHRGIHKWWCPGHLSR